MTSNTLSNRLGYDDDLFVRIHRALGTPLVNQMAWRFDGPIDEAALRRIHDGLARGPLGRRIVSGAVFGARDRWVRSAQTAPLEIDAAPVAADAVADWFAARAAIDLDPYDGPGWALAAAPTADGGTLLSFAAAHVVADGGMMVAAFLAAQSGAAIGRLPLDDLGAAQVTRRDEWRDAGQQFGAAARGLRMLWRNRRAGDADTAGTPAVDGRGSAAHAGTDTPPAAAPAPQRSADKPVPPKLPDDRLPADPATVFVDCPAAEWHAAARAAGGTANSLFMAIVAEILLDRDGAEAGRPIELGISVSQRGGDDDLRSNATTGVAITIDTARRDGIGVVTDLTHIRSRARHELAALADGTRRDTLEPLKPLLQLVPDWLAKLAAANATSPLAFASNMGRVDPRLAAPFGTPAHSIAMRSTTRHATRGMLRRLRGGVTAWWNESGERCTLAVLAFDQAAFPDRTTLAAAVRRVYSRWGLSVEIW